MLTKNNLMTDEQVQLLSRDQVFRFLSIVAQSIAQTLGPLCEVVVHDFADPESSIVSICGNLTGREIGGSLDDLGLSILESGQPEENVLVYETYAPNGKRLKSTSALLRNADGSLFAALCINMDSDTIKQAAELLTELYQVPTTHKHVEEHFSDDPVEVITAIFQEELARRGTKIDGHKIKRNDRIDIINTLLERGMFNMRSAPTIVANLLGVSRFTVYNYINEARTRTARREDESKKPIG